VIEDQTEPDVDVLETIRADEVVGTIFAVSAGLMLLMTFCGWLILFSGLSALNRRVDDVRQERFAQLGDVTNTIRDLDSKLGTLMEKMRRVEQMTVGSIGLTDDRDRRLDDIENQVMRLRERAADGDVADEPTNGGDSATEGPSGPSSDQENGNDQRQ
jgi:hypothetical protein